MLTGGYSVVFLLLILQLGYGLRNRPFLGLQPKPGDGNAQNQPHLFARADFLFVSTVHAETDHPQIPEFRLLAECSGTQCTLSNPLTGASQNFTLSDLENPDLPSEAVGTRHGVTLMWVAGQHMRADVTQLGAWMDHGGFAVEMSGAASDGVRFDNRNAMAGGKLTGTPHELRVEVKSEHAFVSFALGLAVLAAGLASVVLVIMGKV